MIIGLIVKYRLLIIAVTIVSFLIGIIVPLPNKKTKERNWNTYAKVSMDNENGLEDWFWISNKDGVGLNGFKTKTEAKVSAKMFGYWTD